MLRPASLFGVVAKSANRGETLLREGVGDTGTKLDLECP